jgi:dTDP-4-dehydrorhamnose reductase
VSTIVRRARTGAALRVVDDQRGAPTWTHDVAHMITVLLERGVPSGIYHATNAGDATWYELAAATLQLTGIDAQLSAVTTEAFAGTTTVLAARPRFSVLDCAATYALTGAAPHWRDALERAVSAGVHEC